MKTFEELFGELAERARTRPHDSGTVRGILESTGIEFEATYESDVSFDARVPIVDGTDLRDRLRSATSGRVTIE